VQQTWLSSSFSCPLICARSVPPRCLSSSIMYICECGTQFWYYYKYPYCVLPKSVSWHVGKSQKWHCVEIKHIILHCFN
jgi:hypothetical protein